MRIIHLICPMLVCASMISCASPTIDNVRNLKDKPAKSGGTSSSVPRFTGYWNEDSDAKGEPSIVIALSEQRARFYKGETLVGEAPVSTGREGYETKPGKYRVIEKQKEHFSTLYGEFVNSAGKIVGYGTVKDTPPAGTKYEPSPMPHYLRLSDDGTGMHAGFLPGYPASHGCIRLPAHMAQKFFENMPDGGKVTIEP